MGYITFNKSYSSSDDGSKLSGADLQRLETDISEILNGGVSNTNIATGAGIEEAKLTFNTSTGHVHDGSDSAYPLIKHYRKGMGIQYASATTVTVLPGVLDVGGKLFITTASTTLDITTDFLGGQAEPADGPVYIYAYNNSGAIGFKMSTSCPALSDSASNTTEFPLRYYSDATIGKCRLIGIIHNRTDISADMCVNFDLSNFACGSFVGDAADEVIYTGWTPNFIKTFICSDATPANAEAMIGIKAVQRYGFITANPQPTALLYDLETAAPIHATSANGTANSIFAINAQTTAQPGSFTIDAPSTGVVTMWMAWSQMGSI
jgi:hypothetical protein